MEEVPLRILNIIDDQGRVRLINQLGLASLDVSTVAKERVHKTIEIPNCDNL